MTLDDGTGQVINIYSGAKYDVYIGRPGTIEGSGKWGNPFELDADNSREDVLACYRTWLWEQIESGELELAELAELDGKVLACFCAPLPCHGDILLKAAKWAKDNMPRPLVEGETMNTFLHDPRLEPWEWRIDGVKQDGQLTEATLGVALDGHTDREIRVGSSAAPMLKAILKREPELVEE